MPADHWQDVTVTDPDRLTEVEAQIHDCPFGPDEVAFDRPGRTLTVAFRRYGFDDERRVGGTPVRADYEFPWRRSFLRIDHATDYRVDDRARIGRRSSSTSATTRLPPRSRSTRPPTTRSRSTSR